MRLSNRVWLAFFVGILTTGAAFAEGEMSVSRLYLIDPDPNDVSNSLEALEAAVKIMDVKPSKQVGLMPSDLPDRPGEIANQQMHFGPMTVNLRSCGDASYAQVGTQSNYGNALGSQSDLTFGCIYLSKNAIRMAIVFEQKSSSSNGISAWIAGSIRSAVRGDDKDYAKKNFDKMIDVVRQRIPNVLVELEEVPGEVTRPDQDRVASLFPKAQAMPAVPKNGMPSTTNQTVNQTSATQLAPVQAAAQPGASALSDSERQVELLGKLADLKKSGILTDAEFQEQKKKILGNY